MQKLPRISFVLTLVCAGATLAACGVQGATSAGGASGTTGSGQAGASGAAGSGSGTAGSSGAAGGAAGVSAATSSAGSVGTAGGAGVSGAAGASGTAGNTGAAGALSGVTIKIGTVDVPKENAIAFIHIGHSNMAGRARTPTTDRPYYFTDTDPHAWMYHSAANVPYANGAKAGWELALEPKTAGDMGNFRTADVNGGLGTALVKAAVATSPGNYFISLGFGVSSAYCSEFLPGGLYYDKAVAAAKELKGKVTFAAIIIYLGITERHGTAADVQNFPTCINQLTTAIRNDVGEPSLPIMINGYEMGATRMLAPTTAFAQAIIPRIALIPTTVSTSAVIPTDNPIIPIEQNEPFEPDGDHHFTFEGHKEFAKRVLQTMKDKGWWHW